MISSPTASRQSFDWYFDGREEFIRQGMMADLFHHHSRDNEDYTLSTDLSGNAVYTFNTELAVGQMEAVHLADGMWLCLSDRENQHPYSVHARLKDYFLLAAYTTGQFRMEAGGKRQLTITHHNGSAIYLHSAPDYTTEHDEGERIQACTLFIKYSALPRLLGMSWMEMPGDIRKHVENYDIGEIVNESPETSAVVRAMLAYPYTGLNRRLFLMGKAYEFLSQVFFELEKKEHGSFLCRYTRQDMARLNKVRSLLIKNYSRMPNIVELAEQVSMSQRRLKQGFRRAFGQSISQFVRETRLQMALKLLRETELSVADIALIVGYEEHTNFTRAFKSRFNILPKQFRT